MRSFSLPLFIPFHLFRALVRSLGFYVYGDRSEFIIFRVEK